MRQAGSIDSELEKVLLRWSVPSSSFFEGEMMPRAMQPENQLDSFIARYEPEVASLAAAVLARMRERYLTAIELVYDNYNALAIGFSPTERTSEVVFSIALYPKWVSLFFLQARRLQDPDKILQGSGSAVKHIRLPSADALNDPAVKSLMEEAVAKAAVPFDPRGTHRLIIRSVSAKQRPRRPAKKARSEDQTAKSKERASRRN